MKTRRCDIILNGDEILKEHNYGRIKIFPFNEKRIGTNSYDVCLYDELLWYEESVLDPMKQHEMSGVIIKPDGFFTLEPNRLYLGATEEIVENNANDLVPMIEGRSSLGRLGVSIHATAGFGDIGFCGRWTLEITVIHPVIVRAGMPIGQLYWIRTNPTLRRYAGKYAYRDAPTECRLYEEIK